MILIFRQNSKEKEEDMNEDDYELDSMLNKGNSEYEKAKRRKKFMKNMGSYTKGLFDKFIKVDESIDAVSKIENVFAAIEKTGTNTNRNSIFNVEYTIKSELGLKFGPNMSESEVEYNHILRIEKEIEESKKISMFKLKKPILIDFDNFMRGNPHINIKNYISNY